MGNSSSHDTKSKSTAPKSPRKAKFLKYRKSFGAGSKAPTTEKVGNSETLMAPRINEPTATVPSELRMPTERERTFAPAPTGLLQADCENSDGNTDDDYDGGRQNDESTWFGLVYDTNSSSGGDEACGGETCKMKQQSCMMMAEVDAECRRRFSRDTKESEAAEASASNRLRQVSSTLCLNYVDESNLNESINADTPVKPTEVRDFVLDDEDICEPDLGIVHPTTPCDQHNAAELLESVVIELNAVVDKENFDEADSSFAGCGSDPLFTASATSVTPYYSPEEELNVIFGFDMEAKTKIVSTSESSSSASTNGKEISTPNDKEVLTKPNSFTVVKHKKVELSPTTFSTQKTSAVDGKGRQSSFAETISPTPLESNVLRKVASLTFDKAAMEQKNRKSKFTPEKVNLQGHEKFEGQMLINWFLSSSLNKSPVKNSEIYSLALQFCSLLLSVGVIRQIVDKDTPTEENFKPNLMYYWSHTEALNSSTPSPNRFSSPIWPPSKISINSTEDMKPTTEEHTDLCLEILKQRLQEKEKKITALENTLELLQQQLQHSQNETDTKTAPVKSKTELLSPERVVKTNLKSTSVWLSNTDEKKTITKIQDTSSDDKELLNSMNNAPKKSDKSSEQKTLIDAPKSYSLMTSPTAAIRVQHSKIPIPLHKSNSISHVPSSPETNIRMLAPLEKRVKSDDTVSDICYPIDAQLFEPVSISPGGAKTSPVSSTRTRSTQTSSSDLMTEDIIISNGFVEISTSSALSSAPSDSVIPPPPPPMPVSSTVFVPPPPPLPPAPVPDSCYIPPPPPPPLPEVPAVSAAGQLSTSTGFAPPPPPLPEVPATFATSQSLNSVGSAPPPPPPLPEVPATPASSQSTSSVGCAPPPPPPPPPPSTSTLSTPGPPPPPPPLNTSIPPPPPSYQNSDVPAAPNPVPLPTPPLGGWNAQRATFRKQPLTPKMPMKPLYWTRLVVPEKPLATPSPADKSNLVWEEIEEPSINDEEFMSLFSRQVVEKKVPKKKVEKRTKSKVTKLLDAKRSQNVGILASSLHIDFSEIENALYNFDTSVVSLDVLQQIYEVRATSEEIKQIKDHLTNHPDQILDKPEQFLLELSEIPYFAERIACFVIQSEFNDAVFSVRNKLSNIKAICEKLTSSKELKKVIAIILALGNFMNGGNLQRGQADGFGLDILPKLKDVKSKDNSLTLLHYIVKTYLKTCEDPLSAILPIPEPSDVEQAASIQFDDIQQQLSNLHKDLRDCELKVDKITSEEKDDIMKTFNEKMRTFLKNGKKLYEEELENLDESKKKFSSVLKFYHFQPRSSVAGEETNPKDFFFLWAPFCVDFKLLWRVEQQNLLKEKLKETRQKEKERRTQIKKYKKRESGLKATMKNLSNDLEDF